MTDRPRAILLLLGLITAFFAVQLTALRIDESAVFAFASG